MSTIETTETVWLFTLTDGRFAQISIGTHTGHISDNPLCFDPAFEPSARTVTLDELELECNCVLPSQSCPVCRAAARALYGDGDDPLPF